MKYLSFSEIYACFRWLFKNETKDFEEEFARYIGSKYAFGTTYGRIAIYLGLRAIDVAEREVMVPAFTCKVVIDAIPQAGGTLIFIDVNPNTLDMDIEDMKKKITKKTTAILLTHYYGSVCGNLEEILNFAKENNLRVVEDCAHSLGAEYKGIKVGNFGDMAAFSLTKNSLNFGGGMLVTNNKALFENARNILENEDKQKFTDFYSIMLYGVGMTLNKIIFNRIGWWVRFHDIFSKLSSFLSISKKGTKVKEIDADKPANLKMHPIVSSVGRVQLRKMDQKNKKQAKICKEIATRVKHYKGFSQNNHSIKNVYSFFPIWFEGGDINKIRKKALRRSIFLRTSWPSFQELWSKQNTSNIKKIGKSLLIWDVSPMITRKEINRMVKIINGLIEEC